MKTTLVLLLALAAGDAGEKPKATPKPTYRKLLVTCPACDLPKAVRSAAAQGAADCSGANWREVSDCIRKARDAGQPFFAVLKVRGVDSTLMRGFVSRADGTVDKYWYDSDPSGGATPCNAIISRSRCRTLLLDQDADDACVVHESNESVVWCSEASHRTVTVGEPQDASGLHCDEYAFNYKGPGRCSLEAEPGTREPKPEERLLCLDHGRLYCTTRNDGALLRSSYFEVDRKQ